MARKLRFLREQMIKAGLLTSTRPSAGTDVNVENLEVRWMPQLDLVLNFFLCKLTNLLGYG